MKNLIYFIIILLLFVPIGSNFSESLEKEFPLTQKQIEFAEDFKNNENYTKAEWVSPLTFELTYDITQFYGLTNEEAKQSALLAAAYGYTYTLKDICVRIFLSTKKDQLAYECIGKGIPSET